MNTCVISHKRSVFVVLVAICVIYFVFILLPGDLSIELDSEPRFKTYGVNFVDVESSTFPWMSYVDNDAISNSARHIDSKVSGTAPSPDTRNSSKLRSQAKGKNLPQNNRTITQLQHQNLLEVVKSLRTGMDHIKVLQKDTDGNIEFAEETTAMNFRREFLRRVNIDDDVIDDYFFDQNIDKEAYLEDWNDVPRQLKKYAPVVFKVVPKEMEPDFKTPCWYRRGTLKCLPYFYILGMTKCGTSDLWNKTVIHPQVIGTPKENHWWSRRFGRNWSIKFLFKYTQRASGGIDFPNTTASRPKSLKVLGDGSPSTLWNNRYWRQIYPQQLEPPYINADVIATVTPGAKLIVILRDPVERLYSSYNFFEKSKKSASPERFHAVVQESIWIFEECMKYSSLRACTYQPANISSTYLNPTDFTGGLYHVYLEDWMRRFPREQLLILELNDWHDHCVRNLAKVYELLELDFVSDDFVEQSCKQPTRVRPKKWLREPMLNKTRSLLQEKYQPFNERLYEILKDERFDWRYNK